MSALPEKYITLEEYFQLEETSEIKHEYHQGVIYDLFRDSEANSLISRASEAHNLIAGAVFGYLFIQLDGKSCRPYPGDFRLKIEAMNLYTYPDISVICGETQLADGRKDTFVNPTVLIEVLSDSTEAYDRGNKTECYRTIPSLREYLLIAQDRSHVEHYRRHNAGWLLSEYSSLDDMVSLDTIGCTLSLAAIYQRVRFDIT